MINTDTNNHSKHREYVESSSFNVTSVPHTLTSEAQGLSQKMEKEGCKEPEVEEGFCKIVSYEHGWSVALMNSQGPCLYTEDQHKSKSA